MSKKSSETVYLPLAGDPAGAWPRNRFWRRSIVIMLLLPAVVIAVLVLRNATTPGIERAWPWAGWLAPEGGGAGLGLSEFAVTIDARPIAGIDSDVSGLTYDPDRGTLFAITNKRPEIIELSLRGDVLRRIPLSGLEDPEAIEYVGPGRYVVTDERRQALVELSIDETTTRLDAQGMRQLVIGIGRNGNKGFEGLAYDRVGDRLFVAKEKSPLRIYEVVGFVAPENVANRSLQILDNPERDAALAVRDISSLHHDAQSGHLLVLSDDSRAVIEIDGDGRLLGRMSLTAGEHALSLDVPQAEGMSMDDRGNLYVVSEPNLFYAFSRRH